MPNASCTIGLTLFVPVSSGPSSWFVFFPWDSTCNIEFFCMHREKSHWRIFVLHTNRHQLYTSIVDIIRSMTVIWKTMCRVQLQSSEYKRIYLIYSDDFYKIGINSLYGFLNTWHHGYFVRVSKFAKIAIVCYRFWQTFVNNSSGFSFNLRFTQTLKKGKSIFWQFCKNRFLLIMSVIRQMS